MDYKLPNIPERNQISNKGSFGKILNISGSKYMPGASFLSSVSALKTGAGFVRLVSDENVLQSVSCLAPEVVLEPINLTNISELIKEHTVIEFGCGCTTQKRTLEILDIISKNKKDKPLVIDADGLNVLAKNYYNFDKNTILTPHPLEASRLLDCELNKIIDNPIESAKKISEKYNCIAVLKMHETVVTDGKKIYINKTGCSALAKAGSGDVLCGMISGLLAQKMNSYDSAALGVNLHGTAGYLASKDLTEYGVLASDLLKYIPFAIKIYKGYKKY